MQNTTITYEKNAGYCLLCFAINIGYGFDRLNLIASFLCVACRILYHAFFNCVRKKKGENKMEDYKDMYYQLFNKITAVIENLMEIQREMEKMYIEREEVSE